MEVQTLKKAVDAAMPLAVDLLGTLKRETAEGDGVSRETYGAGEQFAHYPAAMIFVRNGHGSHNPAESLDMDDLALGTQLLARFLAS